MGIDKLNTKEVLNIAINMEEAGYLFYSLAMKKSKSEQMRKIMGDLARMEHEHKHFFAQTLEKMSEEVIESDYLSDDVSLYLSSVLSNPYLSTKEEIEGFIEHNSLEKILDYAVGTERDAVAFYSELFGVLISQEGKNTLQKIIDEEKSHIVQIEKLKKAV